MPFADLKNLVSTLEAGFGPAYKFQPNGTQIVLVALILVVAVSTERIVAALQTRAPTSRSR